jgi:hypothetical protein
MTQRQKVKTNPVLKRITFSAIKSLIKKHPLNSRGVLTNVNIFWIDLDQFRYLFTA